MSTIINTQNQRGMSDQINTSLKAVDHSSQDNKTERTVFQSREEANIRKVEKETDVSKVKKPEDPSENKKAPEQALGDAIKKLNNYVQSIKRNIEFNVDEDNGQTVIKVIDSKTEKLIRQIPNEEALQFAKQLDAGLDENTTVHKLLSVKEQA